MNDRARSESGPGVRVGAWMGPALIATSALAMLVWTWRKWPDVLVDFGREIYVPWQLSEGRVLYSDLAYFTGPLSPYLNSVWFHLFGPSLMTLVAADLLVLTVFLCLFHALLLRIGSRLSATVASLVFVALFAFAQHTGTGNYNFVCPYSHELTHGLTLSLGAIGCLSRYRRSRHPGWIAGAGFLVGLLALTKLEVLFAGGLAVAAGLAALLLGAERPVPPHILRVSGCFAAAACIPPAVALALLSRVMPVGRALREGLGYWTAALHGASMMRFQRVVMGIDEPVVHARLLLEWLGWYAAIFVPAAFLSLVWRRSPKRTRAAQAVLFVLVAGILLSLSHRIHWLEAARPLPVFVAAIGVACFVRIFRSRAGESVEGTALVTLSLAVLSFALLLKLILDVRISHYGFALASPATGLLVVALVDRVPQWLDRRGGRGSIFRAAALAALLVAVVAQLGGVAVRLAEKTHTVGSGADAFRADARGVLVNDALDALRARMQPGETLAVVPEGALINFLLRRENSTPYTFLSPFDVALFGEERILGAFRSRPPGHIAFAQQDYSDYGLRVFGVDYGQRLWKWITTNYRVTRVIGGPMVREDQEFIVLMERAAAPSTGGPD